MLNQQEVLETGRCQLEDRQAYLQSRSQERSSSHVRTWRIQTIRIISSHSRANTCQAALVALLLQTMLLVAMAHPLHPNLRKLVHPINRQPPTSDLLRTSSKIGKEQSDAIKSHKPPYYKNRCINKARAASLNLHLSSIILKISNASPSIDQAPSHQKDGVISQWNSRLQILIDRSSFVDQGQQLQTDLSSTLAKVEGLAPKVEHPQRGCWPSSWSVTA